jgi:type VI secretion system Hcp family effector
MNSKLRSKIAVLAVMICSLLAAGSVQAAFDAYMQVEGAKQGKFKGATDDRIAISGFSYQAADKATGMATGRRAHETITITREIDKASPMFLSASKTGEVLNNVQIVFLRPGTQEVSKTMTLTNVMVTGIKQSAGERPTESITLSFDAANVVAKDSKGNKTAMDDWLSKN